MLQYLTSSHQETTMSSQASTGLRDFRDFLNEKLSNGGADLSPEEALDEWRRMHPEPFDDEDDVIAIQAALDDLDRGEKGITLDELDRELRVKFNLPAPPKR